MFGDSHRSLERSRRKQQKVLRRRRRTLIDAITRRLTEINSSVFTEAFRTAYRARAGRDYDMWDHDVVAHDAALEDANSLVDETIWNDACFRRLREDLSELDARVRDRA